MSPARAIDRAARPRPASRTGTLGLVVIGLALGACSWREYAPSPPDQTLVPAEFVAARLDTPAQLVVLSRTGLPHEVASPWTPAQLGLLAVARSGEVRAARTAMTAAAARSRLARQRQNPQVNLGLERHSEEEDWSDSRWSVGPSIDLTLVPPVVRRLTGERADIDVAMARLAAIEAAWQARGAAEDAAHALLAWQEEGAHVEAGKARRDDAVLAARNLVAAGISDAFEWQSMMLDRNDARLALLSRESEGTNARAALAASLTLPLEATRALVVAPDQDVAPPGIDALRTRMLNEHPLVLRALAAHAQAERDLGLAVAAQYPNLQLSPGYFLDQGDHVWSLLGGIVIPLFARQDVAIDSAAAARDAARDAVYAAQASAIAELERAHAAWQAAAEIKEGTRAIVADILAAHDELRRKREQGLGDDLAVARAAIQVTQARTHLAAATAEERRTRARLLFATRATESDAPFGRLLEDLLEEPGVRGATAR